MTVAADSVPPASSSPSTGSRSRPPIIAADAGPDRPGRRPLPARAAQAARSAAVADRRSRRRAGRPRAAARRATAPPSASPTGADACSYTADHFTLVIQAPRARRRPAHRAALARTTRRRSSPPASSGSCCCPRPPARHCCPPRATWPPWSSPSRSPRCPPSRSSASGAATGAPREAALKFFLSSVAATAVMLLGVSFVYATTGTLHLTPDRRPPRQRPRPAGHPRQGGRRR